MYDNGTLTELETRFRHDRLKELIREASVREQIPQHAGPNGLRVAIAGALVRVARIIDSGAGTRAATVR